MLLVAIILSVLIFTLDINTELGVAGGVPYIIVVMLGVFHKDKKFYIYAGASGIVLTVIGYFLSPSGGELYKVVLNRFYAVLAIFCTAFLGYKFKSRDDEFNVAQQEFEHRIKRGLELSDFLTRHKEVSGQEKTFKNAMEICLKNICEITQWPLGHLYLFSDISEKMVSVKVWACEKPDRFAEFIKVSEGAEFKIGVGLPGRIWKQERPVFIPDLYEKGGLERSCE